MAVEDAGGTVLGKPVEIAVADHQNKADIGAAIARRWFDAERVDMAIGFDNSSVALAIEQLAAERNRIAIAGAVGNTAFTGKACTATEASWIYDSYALTTSLARSVVAEGRDTWFFLTVDYAFGYSLEADATSAVRAAGGKVLGSVRHPLNTADFSSYLLQAQASGAKVVALANGGGDMVNAIKQAGEFGLARGGQTVVALLVFVTDVHSMGLPTAQGLKFVTAFYWDRDKEAGPGRSASSRGTEACRPWRRRASIPRSGTISRPSLPPAPTKPKRSWPRCGSSRSTTSMPGMAGYAKTAASSTTCISPK
jgi:branched-chain amino acid transport system substrate-binding protein